MSAEASVKVGPEYTAATVANGFNPQPKVERYDWKMVGEPGQMMWLPKSKLHVDHEYQRTRVSRPKVLGIASEWVWPAVGVLSVARRPDGTYWVFDGQHRKLAADRRTDVQVLPCMVYEMTDRLNEALAYLKINNYRSSMQSIDKMNAELIAQDPVAMAVKEMVERSGYVIADSSGHNSGSRGVVNCVQSLKSAIRKNSSSAVVAWEVAVALFQGTPVTDDVYGGLFTLECYLNRKGYGSLTDERNQTSLMRYTVKELQAAIREAKAFFGGGPKASAEGILKLINKGRSTRRIPQLYTDTANDE